MSSRNSGSGIPQGEGATSSPADAQEEAADEPPQGPGLGETPDAADPAQPTRRVHERIGSAGGGPYPPATPEHEQAQTSDQKGP